MSGFEPQRLQQLRDVVASHVERGGVGGVAWLVARDGQVETGVVGTLTRGEPAAVGRDSLFRISSMTKPIVAVAALILVEECRLRLDDPVDELLPELADRQVLVDPRGPIDGPTVAARAPITVRDVLTFRLGLGMDFDAPWPQPLLEEMDRLGTGAGPPEPQVPPAPDEWMRRLSTLPLLYQPGERWLYHTGADVLGRPHRPRRRPAARRVPEGTGARPAGDGRHRLRGSATWTASAPATRRDPDTGALLVYDGPDGQWATPPAFPSGGGGLVSTVDDMLAFGRMLLSGGCLPDGGRLLARASVEAMTTDQLRVLDGAPGPTPDGSQGWGFGVGVQVRRTGPAPAVGCYGWAGGLGSAWANDPGERLIGVVLTTDMFTSAFPPPAVISDFWTCTYSALAD